LAAALGPIISHSLWFSAGSVSCCS
jgi:hypothetical protein